MRCVMTEEMIEKARAMRGKGMSYVKIGVALGVSYGTVQYNLDPDCRRQQATYRAAHREERKKYNAAYGISHRGEIAVNKATYHAANRETIAAKSAVYRSTHKQERAATGLIYRETRKAEKAKYDRAYRAANKERLASKAAAYRRTHPSQRTAAHAVRRALKRGAMIGATVVQRAGIAEIYQRAKEDPKVRCYLCGDLIPLGECHVDHVRALSKGGIHRPCNLAIACASCNMKKHDKMPEEVGLLF